MSGFKLTFGLAVIMVLFLLAIDGSATGGYHPYSISLKPVMVPQLNGNATLEFGINALKSFDSIVVKVVIIGNLEYDGPPIWTVHYDGIRPYLQNIDVSIPFDDTCGIDFEIYKGKGRVNSKSIHFVTTGDTLEISQYWPTPKVVEKRPLFVSQGDTLDTDSMLEANRLPKKEVDTLPKTAKYTIIESDWIPPTEEEKRDSLERNPLTTYHRQFIRVDGEMLFRDSGEYKFRPAQVISDWDAYNDSVNAVLREKAKTDTIDIVMDLRSRSDYERIKEIVAKLLPMERAGFYHALVTKAKTYQIKDMGIDFATYPTYPDRIERSRPPKPREDNTTPTSSNEDSDPEKGPDDFQMLFGDGFEDNNLSQFWYTHDNNTGNGLDYWGTVSDTIGRVHDGFVSIWCAAVGSAPLCYNYDDNMYSWVRLKYPIEISGITELELCLDAWYYTEDDYDRFEIVYSFDNFDWSILFRESGDCNSDFLDGYYFYIPDGEEYLYVGCRFTSDNSIHNFEGAYVDNIDIYGYIPMPDVAPCSGPFWSDAIVVSNETGTNTSSDLYADQPAYIDVGAINEGDFNGIAAPYAIALFVDNNWVNNFYVTDSTSYGERALFEDYPIILAEGFHDIKMVVDYLDQVEEINEGYDNIYERRFEWVIAKITVYVKTQYRDLGNFGNLRDARKVWVELWDFNFSHPNAILDSAYLDETGYKIFGPKDNIDNIEGGPLDLFVYIYAKNEAAIAYESDQPIDMIRYISWSEADVPPGDYHFNLTVSAETSGGFYAVDRILDGYNVWLQHAPAPTQPVSVVYQQTDKTMYRTTGDLIRINNSNNDLLFAPDVFDGDILIHEYGHRFAFVNFFFDSRSSAFIDWNDSVTLEDAGCEGFAEYWAAYVTGDPILDNAWDNFGESTEKNVETGEWGFNNNVDSSCNNYGTGCPGSVAGILWDIYDNVDDDYDGDGKGDVFDGGPSPMFNIITQFRPRHINDFWDYWINNGYNHNHEMWAIWYEHGDILKDVVPPTGTISINNGDAYTTSLIVDISLDFTDTLSGMIPPLAEMCFRNGIGNPWSVSEPYNTVKSNWDLSLDGGNTEYGPKQVIASVCDAAGFTTQVSATIGYGACVPGDANGDGMVDVGDSRYMISYVFQHGAEPTPYAVCSGDFNGDCSANVGDVVSIINYVFKGGSPPIDCDTWISYCGLPIRK